MDAQKENAEDNLNQSQTILQKEMEKSEKQMQENLESKSLVSRLQDKIKESSPSRRGRKRKNKDISDEKEEGQKKRGRPKQNVEINDVVPDIPSEDLAKIDPKRSRAVATIREILLNNNADLSFDAENSIKVAHGIIASFPVLDESKDKLTKFATFFKNALKHPNIYRRLIEKGFPSKLLSKLYAKSPSELSQLDKKLGDPRQIRHEKASKPEAETEAFEGETIKKKLKLPQASQSTNMFNNEKSQTMDLFSMEESLKLQQENSLVKELATNPAQLSSQMQGKADVHRSNSNSLPQAMQPITPQVEEETAYQQTGMHGERRLPSQANRFDGRHQHHNQGYNHQSRQMDIENDFL